MSKTRKPVFIYALTALAFSISPAIAMDEFDCEEHAQHIVNEIGEEQALAEYKALHDEMTEESMDAEHADMNHELEEFVKHGCSEVDLKMSDDHMDHEMDHDMGDHEMDHDMDHH